MKYSDYMDEYRNRMDEHLRPSIQDQNRRDHIADLWCRAWPFLLILGIAILFVLLQNRQDPRRDESSGYEAAETLLAKR